MTQTAWLLLLDKFYVERKILPYIITDQVAHLADDQRNAIHSGSLDMVKNVPEDWPSGHIEQDFGEREGVGSKTRTDARDRNYGFQ